MIGLEREQLKSWLGSQPRHAARTHEPFESDAEVVRLADDLYLAASVDSVDAEIASGLYEDPYTAGWVAAMSSLADIAAVGAESVGLLLSVTWGPEWDLKRRARLAAGIGAALRRSNTALLGGDTGESHGTAVTATAVGTCSSRPMSRMGATPGDILCVTGRTGAGAALATRWALAESPDVYSEERFRPAARLREGSALRPLASACIDASDGLLQAVYALASLNDLGVSLAWNPAVLADDAIAYFRERRLPLWLIWVSEISDFELVLAIPEAKLSAALTAVPSLKPVGKLKTDRSFGLKVDDRTIEIDPAGLSSFARSDWTCRTRTFRALLADVREAGFP